jgi:hypothetical protein
MKISAARRAMGRKHGSLAAELADQRIVLSLVQSARMNLDPWAYLKDGAHDCLATSAAASTSCCHRWQPAG